MKAKDWPRLVLTAFIMGLLGFAAISHYSTALEQVIVNLAMVASGFWLGSSKGSSDKTEMMEKQDDMDRR